VYHAESSTRPEQDGDPATVDGSPLIQRDGDKAEVVAARPGQVPRGDPPPHRVLRGPRAAARFDGTRSPTEVHDHIRATVATLRLEDEL
jgi:adenylate kinase